MRLRDAGSRAGQTFCRYIDLTHVDIFFPSCARGRKSSVSPPRALRSCRNVELWPDRYAGFTVLDEEKMGGASIFAEGRGGTRR